MLSTTNISPVVPEGSRVPLPVPLGYYVSTASYERVTEGSRASLPVPTEGSRASLPVPPRVVSSTTDGSFLSREAVLTVLEAKAPDETMTAERRVVRIPRVIRSRETGSERFTLLQKWDGVVLEADTETFTARLLDSNGELPPQQATFSRSELSSEEANQIAVGASFVWTIGYRHIGATRHRDSTIYFRRLPPWSEDELKSARDRSEKEHCNWMEVN